MSARGHHRKLACTLLLCLGCSPGPWTGTFATHDGDCTVFPDGARGHSMPGLRIDGEGVFLAECLAQYTSNSRLDYARVAFIHDRGGTGSLAFGGPGWLTLHIAIPTQEEHGAADEQRTTEFTYPIAGGLQDANIAADVVAGNVYGTWEELEDGKKWSLAGSLSGKVVALPSEFKGEDYGRIEVDLVFDDAELTRSNDRTPLDGSLRLAGKKPRPAVPDDDDDDPPAGLTLTCHNAPTAQCVHYTFSAVADRDSFYAQCASVTRRTKDKHDCPSGATGDGYCRHATASRTSETFSYDSSASELRSRCQNTMGTWHSR